MQLIEGAVERGVLVAGVLEFDHAQGQAVNKDHDIGPTVDLVLDHRELVDREPVVGVRVVKVDKPRLLAADGAIRTPHLNRHALNQIAVQAPVFLEEGRGFRLGHLCQYLGAGVS